MSKKKLLFVALFFTMFFTCKNVYAFDSSSYKTRELCGQFEVAGFHNDGYIDKVECFDDYASASTFMRNNGAADLAIMTYVNGEVKIIDANRALLDLTVNPEQLTYYNTSPDLTGRQYTYMQNHSVYRDGDGAFLGTGWSSTYYKCTGWIPQEAYEIVPCTWIKSHSYYVVTNDSITHYLVTKIQDGFPSSYGHTIGPKPEQLSPGWYYSYDGHYFYSKMEDLMDDYKNNILSIQHSYLGTLSDNINDLDNAGNERSISGLVAKSNKELDMEIRSAIQAAYKAINAIPAPFRNNLNASTEIKDAMEKCAELTDQLEKIKTVIK